MVKVRRPAFCVAAAGALLAALGVHAERPAGKARLEDIKKAKGEASSHLTAISSERKKGANSGASHLAAPSFERKTEAKSGASDRAKMKSRYSLLNASGNDSLLNASDVEPPQNLADEIARAKANETYLSDLTTQISSELIGATFDARLEEANQTILASLAVHSNVSKAAENSLKQILNETWSDWMVTTMAELQTRTKSAKESRQNQQRQLSQVWSALRHQYCPPVPASDRGADEARVGSDVTMGCSSAAAVQVWADMGVPTIESRCENYKGLLINSDAESPWTSKYATFEEAWYKCAETTGCSQVLQLSSTAGSVNLGGGAASVSLADGYDGYYLRSRSELAFAVGVQFDWAAWAMNSVDSGVTGSGVTNFTATNYECGKLCPAACQNGDTLCGHCATKDDKTCSACDTTTMTGCAGNCEGKVDCGSCPTDGPIDWRTITSATNDTAFNMKSGSLTTTTTSSYI